MKRSHSLSFFSVLLSLLLTLSLFSGFSYFIIEKSDDYETDSTKSITIDPDFTNLSIYNDQVSYLGDSFAGRYVDENGVTILVTKSAPEEKVTSFKNSYPKFTVREVTNSLQELQTIKNLIVSEMTSNPSRGIASVYTDIVHNKVVVDIINLDFSKETSFRQQVSNSPTLEIRSVDSYDEATYTIFFWC